MSDVLTLHRMATARGRIGYTERKRRYDALQVAATALCARLPFRWHARAMDNPTQNHTGSTNGSLHIVLDEPYSNGRLQRNAGKSLCGCPMANLWNPADGVTCKRCLEMAQRIVEKGGDRI